LGYNQPLEGRGPVAAYGFYYLNKPDFPRTNITLRLALAPIYLDTELGFKGALGEHTDLGLGVSGGGFADGYSEIRAGHFYQEESFTGHGGEVHGSVYHLFNPAQRIPLHAVVRGAAHFTAYERDMRTAPGFVLPDDRSSLNIRAGLRWGGREPLLTPALAMEISGWYESQFRVQHGSYGYAGDRFVEANSHLFWTRALLIYTAPESERSFSASLTAGGSLSADRFNAFRLGAVLPFSSEFPLQLPGYYFQEITANRFVSGSGSYTHPLDAAKQWSLTAFGTMAAVHYVSGTRQPGDWHSGVGGALGYRSPNKVWQIIAGYAYGVDALRSHGRGAQSVGVLIQYDLDALQRSQPHLDPAWFMDKLRGLKRLFGS